MKILFSPSKTMKIKNLNFDLENEIIFKEKTDFIIAELKKLSLDQVQEKFKIKSKLLEEVYNNIQNYSILQEKTAIELYDGVTFRQLQLENYTLENINYLKENLFIFSALYGILRANTKIKPYRLDMTINFLEENLYKFWEKDIEKYLINYDEEVFINLASKEFSKQVSNINFNIINIEFRQLKDGALKNISTEAKKARGKFLNYMVINNITSLEELSEFRDDGYIFSPELSDKNQYIFIKNM